MSPEAGSPGINGLPRSYWATPWELRRKPWTLDFAVDDRGLVGQPLEFVLNPYAASGKPVEWRPADWDPALRYWALPFDRYLKEWLQTSADLYSDAIVAAREFAAQYESWRPIGPDETFVDRKWIRGFAAAGTKHDEDLAWWPYTWNAGLRQFTLDAGREDDAWSAIKTELEQLRLLMEDDRLIYLDEADWQADGIPDYIGHFIAADATDHPETLELIRAALAIGGLVYLAYKAFFRRVRPSALCPGLIPPFGPPEHPSFPSGHAFLSHLIALLLLELPGVRERFGLFALPSDGTPGKAIAWKHVQVDRNFVSVDASMANAGSPLLRIAERLAVNRERIGVHYRSDSTAGRHLAAGVWDALIQGGRGNADRAGDIVCPTLLLLIERAKAEWPQRWS